MDTQKLKQFEGSVFKSGNSYVTIVPMYLAKNMLNKKFLFDIIKEVKL